MNEPEPAQPGHVEPQGPTTTTPRPTLTAAVRRRRADQAFFIRIGRAIHEHESVLDRLSQ